MEKSAAEAMQPPLPLRLLNRWGSGVGRLAFRLDAERLMQEARRRTGLQDFGGEAFQEPLRRMIRSLEEEGDLSLLGRLSLRRGLLRLLVQRLRIAEDLRRHPEILEVPTQRPLFIVGFMRTGTTLLYNLLARMPGARAPRLWELLHPSPPPEPATEATDPRIELVRRFTAQADRAVPALRSIHALEATAPEECLFLLGLCFTDFAADGRANLPSYMGWLKSADMVPSYRYHRQVLQLLTWKVRGRHLVLKSPVHLFALDALLAVYPDALILQTHRDPREVAGSSCSLYEASRVLSVRHCEPRALGPHWLETWGEAMDKAMAVRAGANPAQFLDVHYEDLMADPVGQVQRIHRWAGLGGEEAAPAVVQAWLAENPKGRHGAHRYTLERYGLTAPQVAERFRAYDERFLVTPERARARHLG